MIEPKKEPRADYIRNIIADVEVGEKTSWSVEEWPDGTCELQIHIVERGKTYRGIKWNIGILYSKQAILATMFESLLAAANDKLREYFLYKGTPVFEYGTTHSHLLKD